MFHKVAVLIDGGFFLQRFRYKNGVMPRIADIHPFLTDSMQKVQATTINGTDTLFRSFYYDCRPYGDTQTDPNGKNINLGYNRSLLRHKMGS